MTLGKQRRPCPSTLGKVIYAWRMSQGLSQAQAAARIGVLATAVQHIEQGMECNARTLLAIMEWLLEVNR